MVSSMVLVAVYTLIIAHPGPVFAGLDEEKVVQEPSRARDNEK